MLERLVSDLLVRVLGQYVHGITPETVRVGVWSGDLELHQLALRPDALAVLFETLGLDLPVTVSAGFIGTLSLKVPWKALRSSPVLLSVKDLSVVAAPVSDGDQEALAQREARLKAARLDTDDAVRDARLSVEAATNEAATEQGQQQQQNVTGRASRLDSSRLTRWRRRVTDSIVSIVVNNIQVDVENVVVKYQDASSVRSRPYTVSLAVESIRGVSTNRLWEEAFITENDADIIYKVLQLKALVTNWEPGIGDTSHVDLTPSEWAASIRRSGRRVIHPLDGDLRIALATSHATAIRTRNARVQMDLCIPDVRLGFDEFQYHTLLSTIMYLSDIDRKVRPKTAKGRWLWALERLLPRFKERHLARLRLTPEGLRERREQRELYVRTRMNLVLAKRSGLDPGLYANELSVLRDMETMLSYCDVVLFRDLADSELRRSKELQARNSGTAVAATGFWRLLPSSLVSRSSGAYSVTPASSSSEIVPAPASAPIQEGGDEQEPELTMESAVSVIAHEVVEDANVDVQQADDCANLATADDTANFCLSLLIRRGSIQLSSGGFPDDPREMSCLIFRELRLGVTTGPGDGLLIEGLLGTLDVLDLLTKTKVMYPRVGWSGTEQNIACGHSASPAEQTQTDFCQDNLRLESQNVSLGDVHVAIDGDMQEGGHPECLRSYPNAIASALRQIHRGHEKADPSLFKPSASGLESSRNSYNDTGLHSDCSSSTGSLFSDGGSPRLAGRGIREDLTCHDGESFDFLVALRLRHERVTEDLSMPASTRLAMDLAIGGLEAMVDGPHGSFVSSVLFWHPREKLPSIMQFLNRAAAPRLATLRMNLQRALLDKKAPMRMNILIRGPRFILPGPVSRQLSLVVDFGTFAMETASGESRTMTVGPKLTGGGSPGSPGVSKEVEVRCTDYRMSASDLGIYVVSAAGRQAAERLIRPFSLLLLLQVLNDASYLETVADDDAFRDLARLRLYGQLSSVKTTVSHSAFRQLLEIAHVWSVWTQSGDEAVAPRPDSETLHRHLDDSPSLHGKVRSCERNMENGSSVSPSTRDGLISFEMRLEFDDLRLELRDISGKRIVTLSTEGTAIKLVKHPRFTNVAYRVRKFTIEDGSRGATAPFRRLLYAGHDSPLAAPPMNIAQSSPDRSREPESHAFVQIFYTEDIARREQELSVHVLSLNMICVRETYLALADFFYMVKRTPASCDVTAPRPRHADSYSTGLAHQAQTVTATEVSGGNDGDEYDDPFAAVGMTTSTAVRALKKRAERGVEISKRAFASRGQLKVSAKLDGLDVTLVTAEGAIASFDVQNCEIQMLQSPHGSITAQGEFRSVNVRDLTAAFDLHSHAVSYRSSGAQTEFLGRSDNASRKEDGWTLHFSEDGRDEIRLSARFTNLKIVYVQRFIVILKKYLSALRDELEPVLAIKGGISDVFSTEADDSWKTLSESSRLRLDVIAEDVDVIMPRHSQSPHEALRFCIGTSTVTNSDLSAPGYALGFRLCASSISSYVLYGCAETGYEGAGAGPDEDLYLGPLSFVPAGDLVPFAENIYIVAKVDMWRCRRVPQVVLNEDGVPVLKDGEHEIDYDPQQWLPALRVRVSVPEGISARLCEAEYSILYFTFTENIIERPEIEFTDIVRGLKTPVLPPRRPIQPIMLSSNRLPSNYCVIFEIPHVNSVVAYGATPTDVNAQLIETDLARVVGRFDYGVDSRMTLEVSCDVSSMRDIRPVPKRHPVVIQSLRKPETPPVSCETSSTHDLTLSWDRPYGHRANVMLVMSDIRIVVVPELFRDLGRLTSPGFPYLKSSAPAPTLRFNGRLLIATLSRPEIWLLADQFVGDGRSVVVRGDVIAKVQWAAVTGRNLVEVVSKGVSVGLSNSFSHDNNVSPVSGSAVSPQSPRHATLLPNNWHFGPTEAPLLYPFDVSLRFHAGGYDPPDSPNGAPVKAPGSILSLDAESLLGRIDVNDVPVLLAVASGLIRLQPSYLSRRPIQPGRFDEWIDRGEDGDARLSIELSVPTARILFTHEASGRCIPIMEARARYWNLRSNVPWMTHAKVQVSLDLFNEEKGWWEPGIERFSIEMTASRGRSGSTAVSVRAVESVEINITPSTVSGAARVAKTIKIAVEDLIANMGNDANIVEGASEDALVPRGGAGHRWGKRPSVAAFCVQNRTGRPASVWLPYDSTRQVVRGDGGEIEMDLPTDEVLWPSISIVPGSAADANKNRHSTLRCYIAFTGYESIVLSAAEVGVEFATLVPEISSVSAHDGSRNCTPGGDELRKPLSIIWDVTMRDGVPVGCLRSSLRVVNETRTALELCVGSKSNPTESSSTSSSFVATTNQTSSSESSRNQIPFLAIVEAGGQWCVPVAFVNLPLRIRPALFHAPEDDADGSCAENMETPLTTKSPFGRVLYSYRWSDILPPSPDTIFSSKNHVRASVHLRTQEGRREPLQRDSKPICTLSCRSSQGQGAFWFSLAMEHGNDRREVDTNDSVSVSDWFDIRIRAPIVVHNILPRSLSYAIADSRPVETRNGGVVVARGTIEPLKEAHVHTAGGDLQTLALGLGYNNLPSYPEMQTERASWHVASFHNNVSTLTRIPLGPAGARSSITVRLDQLYVGASHQLFIYSEYWIQNRSDIGLFFRDRTSESRRAGWDKEVGPKLLLRACPPGSPADPYVCFSGPWLAFQRMDATEDIWVEVGEDISEIDKPTILPFEGLGLSLDVRAARGKHQRSLIVTIRNRGWLENRTNLPVQWCQPAALSYRGIVLSSRVHTVLPRKTEPLHWDFLSEEKAVCLRIADDDGTSDWIWSRPVTVEGAEGEFAAKMYRPKRHEQYIARVIISKLRTGTTIVTVHAEDRSTPPYRIVNFCANRSVAFRQAGADETHPWLVRPGKTTRYSWDDPRAPLKRRSLVVEIIESKRDLSRSNSRSSLSQMASMSSSDLSTVKDSGSVAGFSGPSQEIRYPKFTLSIDALTENVESPNPEQFVPPLQVSVTVDGPTKVVTFRDIEDPEQTSELPVVKGEKAITNGSAITSRTSDTSKNLDVELTVQAVGVSLVDFKPVELAYLTFSGVLFRLDRFDSSELIVFEILDVQVDNQLSAARYPVALWSPVAIPASGSEGRIGLSDDARNQRMRLRKPVVQVIVDGNYPRFKDGISRFRGVFVAVQQLEVAADEEFVLRLFLYAQSLIEASGEVECVEHESLSQNRQDETDLALHLGDTVSVNADYGGSVLVQRLYVEQLELCPLKFTVSFTSSRSPAVVRIAGYRTFIRTLMAAFGNVEHAEFRLNALELRHAFDTSHHFRSLISEFYIAQALSQKMALLTSNPLVGNPSALFDSIAIGTRDFFVEPSRAKGSAEFIAGIGRGSSSLLTNTVGGIVGSLGGIPRAVAQGLETAVGDKDYLAERDSIRGRGRVSTTPAQGLFTGAMSFGHGIASGAAGLVREPVRGAMENGPSGFLKGLGKGVIGGVLKPITGVLDLIGEPAVGFHSMMTTGHRDFAEPVRPARAFWGTGSRRLIAYDMHAALGQAVLNAIGNFQEEAVDFEELRAWTPLVAVPEGTQTTDLVAFLWALHRRSAPSSQYRSKAVLDGRGEPQRADRMRCALVTQRRLIISSMDGRAIWEVPLRDVIDTQLPRDAVDSLLVGIHPRRDRGQDVPPSAWERISCGSRARRDELNEAIKKGIGASRRSRKAQSWAQDAVMMNVERPARRISNVGRHGVSLSMENESSSGDIEMMELSRTENEVVGGDVVKNGLSALERSAKPPGSGKVSGLSRGPVRYPGQGQFCESGSSSISLKELCQRYPSTKSTGYCRFLRLFVVNGLAVPLRVYELFLRCGAWNGDQSWAEIGPSSLRIFEASDGGDRVSDVAGCISLRVDWNGSATAKVNVTGENEVEIRFMNPMLGGNAYAIKAPKGVHISREGGDNGDKVDVLLVIDISR